MQNDAGMAKRDKDTGRVTITLDKDVIAYIEGVSKAQRDSFSGMCNRMLAQCAGLIPRERDRPQWTE